MDTLKIALLQIDAFGNNQEKNLEKGEEFCRQASKKNVDITLFPEMWNIGYTPYHDEVWELNYDPFNPKFQDLRDKWKKQAVSKTSSFVSHFRDLAKELNMAIAITYLEEVKGSPRNSMSLINRDGEIVYTYAKIHTCDFSLEAACTPGEDFYVDELETKLGKIKIGSMICYDREFPESARILMLKGAEIILVPNATEMNDLRTDQLKTRAYENMVGIALANYPRYGGKSVAFDGIAFDEHGERNILLTQAGKKEGIYIAEFNIEELRKYRKTQSWGNAFRKPSKYSMLISLNVKEPFKRRTARRKLFP